MLRTFTLYAEANQAQTELQLALAQRDALARQRESNRRLMTSGEGTVTDTLETQARLDLAEAEVIATQDKVEASREALAIAIGQEIRSLAPLKNDFRPEALPIAPLGELLAAIDTYSPSVTEQRLQLAAAGHEASRARAARLPKLELVANLYRANSDTISTFQQESLTTAVGLQLRVPLYSGGAMAASVKQAVAGRNRAAAVLEATTQESRVMLRQHRNALVSGRSRIAALQVSLDSAALLIDATERSASAGARTNLDVLQARSQWYQVRRDLSLARYQYLVAYLELRRTAGLLDEGDLRLVAQQFQESSAPGGAE
jgi:protease secretion system outer membrane protein